MSLGAQKASARVAAKNAVKIRAALKASVDGRRVYAQYMETNPPVTKDRVLARARARAWAMSNVKMNLDIYLKVLAKHYADMYVLGQSEAAENMANRAQKGSGATISSKPKTNAQGQVVFDPSFSINWDNWEPGNAAAAALISKPGGLKQLLNKADVQSEGIAKYGYDLIGTTVADGIANGDTPTQIGNAIADAISSPERALTIAITEGQRAKIEANLNSYTANGVEQIEWTTNDPCPDCAENDGKIVTLGDDFPSGDTQPPVHPNCQCDVIPVMPDLSGSPEYADLTDEEVAARLEMGATADLGKYSPDQGRDERGRFGSGSGESSSNPEGHTAVVGTDITSKMGDLFGRNSAEYTKSEGFQQIKVAYDNGSTAPIIDIIAKAQGFDGLPKVVSSETIDKLANDPNYTIAYRGIAGDKAGQYFEEFKTGDYHAGQGYAANGIYLAQNEDVARGYAGDNGVVMRVAIPNDQMISAPEFNAAVDSTHEATKDGYAANKYSFWGSEDPGATLAAQGVGGAKALIDVGVKGAQNVYVVWNRTMLTVQNDPVR
jgi:SPP1 gp7 family putative phage head morphogenesis protein